MGKQCKEEQCENGSHVKCCWKEPILDSKLVHEYCQTCRSVDGKGTWGCEPKLKSIGISPMFGEDSSTERGEALVQPEHSQPGGKNASHKAEVQNSLLLLQPNKIQVSGLTRQLKEVPQYNYRLRRVPL
jgi:hypothetical protein